MADAQLEQQGQAPPALLTKDNLDNKTPATADLFAKSGDNLPELINPSAVSKDDTQQDQQQLDRPSTPPAEKRVIHSTNTNPTSPPPEQSVSKKLKMSAVGNAHSDAVTKVEKQPALLIKKLTDKAKAPTRGSAFAAGYDMYASEACVVPKGGKALVETGLSMAVPDGCCKFLSRISEIFTFRKGSMLMLCCIDGRIAPRSGLG